MSTKRFQPHWDESISASYIDYGKYFVPAREQQMKIIVDLLKEIRQPGRVLELCCGEGLLAELILDTLLEVEYLGLDGSPVMLEKAASRLSRFNVRARLAEFELADRAWRKLDQPVQAVASSLAIHHLVGEEKRSLFQDVYSLLEDGGVFVIADVVQPASAPGQRVAADAWDGAVRQRSIELDGNTAGADFFLREHWNMYRYSDPEDIDHPSPLFDQLKWLEQAGFEDIDLHFFLAGHALFSGWKHRAHTWVCTPTSKG
jgi:tRNA (cmo5U34)-methyltransferase